MRNALSTSSYATVLLVALLLAFGTAACGDDGEVYADNNEANNAVNNVSGNNATNNGTTNNGTTNNGTNNGTNNNGLNNGSPCGDYAIGDTWDLDCNTCTCTAEGPACTAMACPDACEGIAARYNATIEAHRSCEIDDECQHLSGQCGVGLGGCYAAVNDTLTQEELSALGTEFSDAGCTDGVCDCAPAAPVACVDGVCDFLPFCGDHELGESWQVECNVCECTFEGVICTLAECSPCGEHAVGESWLDEDGCNSCTCTEAGPACTDRACDVCTGIEGRYDEAIAAAAACEVADDCQVISGSCGVGLGGCHYAVNDTIDTDALAGLADEYSTAGCTSGVCRCAAPPAATCTDGACALVQESPCGEHAIGETWRDADGCNSCTCTVDGVACTDQACPTCESVEAQYDALVAQHSACDTDEECVVVFGHCGIGVGGCYYFVNSSLSEDELDAIASTWTEIGCTGPVCDCAAPPESLACVDSVCVPN